MKVYYKAGCDGNFDESILNLKFKKLNKKKK